jgi:hypothetical protein
MHFPVDAQEGAIRVYDGGGVVIEARGALFEKGGNDNHAMLFSQGLKGAGARTGDGLGQFEIGVILGLAKVLGTKKLLGADDPGALAGRFGGHIQCVAQVDGGIGIGRGLEQCQSDRGGGCVVFQGHNQEGKTGRLKPEATGLKGADTRKMQPPGRQKRERQNGEIRTVTSAWCAKKQDCQGAERLKTPFLLGKRQYFSCNHPLRRFNAQQVVKTVTEFQYI